jgi:sec-independent protein translocase protein TatB
MSFSETIFLFFLALIVFGPKKLPEIARQIGKALNEFRRASNEFKSQIEHEISSLEVEERAKKAAEAQASFPAISSPPEGTAARTLAEATSGTAVGVEPASVEASSVESGSPEAAASSPSTDLSAANETCNPPAEGNRTHEAVTQQSQSANIQDPQTPESQTHEAVISSRSQESHA